MIDINIEKTEAACKKLAKDNATVVQQYILDREDYFDQLPPEKKASKEIQAQLEAWKVEKKRALAIVQAVEGMADFMPPLLAVMEMTLTMPIGSDAEKNKKVVHITKENALKVKLALALSGHAGFK